MPGGQFSHFRDKISLARDTGHRGSIPGRSRPFRDGWQPYPGGAYSAPPDPLAGFKGSTSKGREGRGRKRGHKGEGRDQEKGKGVQSYAKTIPEVWR